MSMSKLQYIEFDNVADNTLWIAPLSGNVDFRQPQVVAELAQLYEHMETNNTRKVVLDLSLLSYFGSTLLEWMVLLWKKLRERRGVMVLFGPSPIGREVLTTVHFHNLWAISDVRDEALRLLNEQLANESESVS
jgi:anti-anti-sigma factor